MNRTLYKGFVIEHLDHCYRIVEWDFGFPTLESAIASIDLYRDDHATDRL